VQRRDDKLTMDRENSKRNADSLKDANVYLAALRATAPLAAVLALALTVSVYVLLGETGISEKIEEIHGYAGAFGAFTVILGFAATVFIWLVVALFGQRYTAADSANRRNYNLLREKLHRLRSRIDHSCPNSSGSQEEPTN
jgi:uncharacterized BrkB/YihY/UPF0761 family membrane protein